MNSAIKQTLVAMATAALGFTVACGGDAEVETYVLAAVPQAVILGALPMTSWAAVPHRTRDQLLRRAVGGRKHGLPPKWQDINNRVTVLTSRCPKLSGRPAGCRKGSHVSAKHDDEDRRETLR